MRRQLRVDVTLEYLYRSSAYPNPVAVQRSEAKADVTSSLSTLLTDLRDGEVTRSTDFGTFQSSVENLDQDLIMIRREFTTSGEPLTIPFTRSEPSLQMIFSLDGQSVLNNKFDPYILSP